MSFNICDKCGRELNGLSWGYGRKWACSDCAEDKTSVLHCENGCNVKVNTLKAGYDSEQKEMEKLFKVGEVYIVDNVEVGRSSSTITLKEFPNKSFNTVFFKRTALL